MCVHSSQLLLHSVAFHVPTNDNAFTCTDCSTHSPIDSINLNQLICGWSSAYDVQLCICAHVHPICDYYIMYECTTFQYAMEQTAEQLNGSALLAKPKKNKNKNETCTKQDLKKIKVETMAVAFYFIVFRVSFYCTCMGKSKSMIHIWTVGHMHTQTHSRMHICKSM